MTISPTQAPRTPGRYSPSVAGAFTKIAELAEPTQEPDAPGVTKTIQNIADTNRITAEMISRLEAALAPILAPPPSTGEAGLPNLPFECPHHEVLAGLARGVSENYQALATLYSRIRL